MNVFNFSNNNLTSLSEKPFKLEKEIQTLFETNLSTLSGFTLIKSEFKIKNRRIDTLGYM